MLSSGDRTRGIDVESVQRAGHVGDVVCTRDDFSGPTLNPVIPSIARFQSCNCNMQYMTFAFVDTKAHQQIFGGGTQYFRWYEVFYLFSFVLIGYAVSVELERTSAVVHKLRYRGEARSGRYCAHSPSGRGAAITHRGKAR